jgi:hypothetical protein
MGRSWETRETHIKFWYKNTKESTPLEDTGVGERILD